MDAMDGGDDGEHVAPIDIPDIERMPTVSNIVHYVLPNAKHRPAMVVAVRGKIRWFVDVQVFTNDDHDRSAISERDVEGNVPPLVYRSNVPWSSAEETSVPNTWHWPEN